MALRGVAARSREPRRGIVTTTIEHHAVVDTAKALRDEGWPVDLAGVDIEGRLRLEDLRATVDERTALVSLISVADLMFEAKQINGSTFLSAQAFGTALIIYYIFARLIVTPFMRWLEAVMARKMGRA
jgi:hypothetical protein